MADNITVKDASGNNVVIKTKDVGAGVECAQNVLSDASGAALIGRAAAAASLPLVLSNEDSAVLGALTEAAPGTDTASSGLNGRLQRIAQRLSSLIGLLPAALGTGGGLKVDGSGTALPVSGTITANAGSNLNTSLLALEAGGNLATVVSYTSRLLSGAIPTAGGAATSTTAQAVGGTYNATPPTLTDTQQAGVQLDANGRLLATIKAQADDPLVVVVGAKADAKASQTDTTAISLMQVLKQCSFSLQALVTAIGGNLDLSFGTVGANTQRITVGTDDVVSAGISKISASEYDDVAASTTRKLGGTGAQNDYLAGITIFPETTSPGAITLQDGNSTAVTIFVGGASSVSNLVPFFIPFGDSARTATTPGWTLVTGANVHARGHGNFT